MQTRTQITSTPTHHRQSKGQQRFGFARVLLIVFTLAALVLPMLTPPSGQIASAASSGADGAEENYELKVTADGTRKQGALLEDAGVVSGNIYVFLTPKKSAKKGVERSRFYLNPADAAFEDSEMLGEPFSTDTKAPFDLVPGKGSQANAFDTTTLPNGTHTIVGVLDLKSGVTIMVAASFEVYNGAPALVFDTPALDFDVQQGAGEQTLYVDLFTSNGTGQDVVFTGLPSWLRVDSTEFQADGSVRVAPESFSFIADGSGLPPGTYTATITAQPQGKTTPEGVASESGDGVEESISPEAAAAPMQSDTMDVSMTVADAECVPLACEQIKVQLPYVLDFDTNHGKIADRNGVGTGFTYLNQPSRSTGHITANTAINFAGIGTFDLTTTRGLMHLANNNQDNALGVGIDIPSQVTIIDTVITKPTAGTGSYEQAGLWFGNNEDNYIKLNVVSKPQGLKVEFIMEVGGQVVGSKVTDAMSFSNSDVRLVLRVDPGERTVNGFFAVGESQSVSIGSFSPPEEFFSFDAAGIDPRIGTRSFAGPYASHRLATTPVTYHFDSFSVSEEDDGGTEPGAWTFNRSSFPVSMPTSMVWGPDNRLYVSEMFGTIHAFTLNGAKQVIAEEVINTIGTRLTLGITIDPASTPSNVILWVSHSNPSTSAGEVNSGVVTKLSGPGFTTRTDVITGLPRAWANHAPNSLHFGPDGKLYIAIGGNTGAGSANTAATEFGTRAEQPLSAALVVADVKATGFDGTCAQAEGAYYPAPCSVTVFASGLRNTYDFVHHSNGHIYGPDNGLGVTGSYPPNPTAPCTGFGSTTSWQNGGNNPGSQPDKLHMLEQGKYYGHPNPYRNECVFFSGSYQGVTPPSNYVAPMYIVGDHRSANGTLEYTSDAFSGSLKGAIIVANYSFGDNIVAYFPSADGRSISNVVQVASGLSNPLPITQAPDGTIFVGELGSGQVTALIPAGNGPGDVTPPAAPTGLTDVAGSQGVTLDWADNTDADLSGYHVYRATNAAGPFTRANTVLVQGSTYVDVAAPEGLPIFYRVTAIDTAGNESGPSNVVDAIRPSSSTYSIQVSAQANRSGAVAMASATVAGNIYAFVAPTQGVTQVRFWIDNPDMVGNAVRYEYSPPFDLVGGNAAAAQPYNTAQLADGQHILTALLMKSSGPSETLHVTFTVNNAAPPDTTPPAVPTALTATGISSGIELDWADNTETDLAGYNVYRAATAAGPFTKINTVLITGSSYNDGTVAQGQSFSYQVKAVDTTGNESAATATVTATRPLPPDTTPPAAPTGLVPTASGTGIALDWANNTESDLAGYNVYRSTTSGGTYTRLNATLLAASDYADTTAAIGQALYYRVTAVDATGNESAASATVNATRPVAPATIALPGTFQAEDYKAGGPGVGYNDTTPGNTGGKYRTDDVDIQSTNDSATPGGFHVSHIMPNEWLAYDVSIAEAGTYRFSFRAATPNSNRRLRVELDGVDVTGQVTMPNTGSYTIWGDVTTGPIALPAGDHTLKIVFTGQSYNLNQVTVTKEANTGNGGNSWATGASAPVAMLDAGSAVLNDQLYMVGGKTSGSTRVRALYAYTPATDSWATLTSMPNAYPAVENPAVVAHNGKLYVFGGGMSAFTNAVAHAAVYDPGTQAWTMLTSAPSPRAGATAQGVGNLIYVIGGFDNAGNSVNTMDIYNPQTNAWTAGPSMQTRRDNPGSGVINGLIYVVGGRTRDADGTTVVNTLNTIEVFDPANGTWSTAASMPTGRRTMAVGVVNGTLIVMGGESGPGSSAFAQNERYDPTTNSWTSLAAMPTGRHGMAYGVINGKVYTATGGPQAGSAFINIVEIYTP